MVITMTHPRRPAGPEPFRWLTSKGTEPERIVYARESGGGRLTKRDILGPFFKLTYYARPSTAIRCRTWVSRELDPSREPHPQLSVGDEHNMTVSWRRRLCPFRARPKGDSMMLVVLIGGIGLLVAGLVTVGLGIELELSFGNTLLLAGVIVACTGVLMLGLWIAVRELKAIARQLSGLPAPSRAAGPRPSAGLNAVLGDQAPEDDEFPFGREQPAPEHAGHAEPAVPLPAPPWLEEATSRGRGEAPGPAPVEAPAVTRPRRNLLFSSSSRKERERAQARAAEPSLADLSPAASGLASPALEPAEPDARRPRPSTTPGRGRNVPEPAMRHCHGAAAGRHRPLPMRRPALPRRIALRRPCEARIRRRSRCSNPASSMEWPIRCIPTVRSRRRCPKA